jgi:hypothetical protein
VWLIYALTIAQFVVASFFEPASNAIVPGLVSGPEELRTANVLSSITWSAMLTIGAALGGVFAGIFGAQLALIADSVTFLISAGFLLRMDVIFTPAEPEVGSNRYKEIFEGFRYILRERKVAAYALVKSFGQIGSADIFAVVFAEQYFPYGQDGALSLGVLFGAMGLGAILGPLVGNRLISGSIRSLKKAVQSGYILIPIGWSLVFWSPNLWVAALGLMIRLMGTSLNWTYSNVLIQQIVPDRYLGRVFALDLGLFTLTTSIATFFTGFFLDQTQITLRGLGGSLALASLIPAVWWAVALVRSRDQDALIGEG